MEQLRVEATCGVCPVSSAVATGVDAETAARLRLATVRLSRRLRLGDGSGLTQSQLSALATIDHHGPLRIGELAAREAVNPTTLSRIVARLEDAGLVDRTADERDRRGAVLEITATGRRVLADSRQERTGALRRRLEELDPEQARAIVEALPALEELASGLPFPGGRG